MKTKQVIVIRRDLKMRRGKECAQASHASMAFLTRDMQVGYDNEEWIALKVLERKNCEEIDHWLENSFRKICVSVNSEQELLDLHQKALAAGLMSHLITDSGKTEFGGVPTNTCLAIGPHFDEKFVGITDHLPLY